MKVQTKILAVVLFLIALLALNTLISLRQLSKVSFELESVAKKDVVLMELSSRVMHHQLERGILLERAIRIAEELAFEDVAPARRDHLMLNAKITKGAFEELSQKGATDIVKAKDLIADLLGDMRYVPFHPSLQEAQALISQIERFHIEYDAAVVSIMERMVVGGFELAFEDIDRVQRQDRLLTKKLQALLKVVQGFVEDSVERTRQDRQRVADELWMYFVSGLFLGLVFLWIIIRRIHYPLKRLVSAAKQVSRGDFDIHLGESSRDEFGELSRAFNEMSQKIGESSRQLQEKNMALTQSLRLTERNKRDLERMNRDLDELVKILSQDIRSPLTNLTGYGAILYKEYGDKVDERGKRCITGIKKSTDRITSMIDDLLAMKQIVNQDIKLELTDIRRLVESVKERIQYKLLGRKADFIVNPDLPVVACDSTKIGIVFLNLLNNAVKFSPQDDSHSLKIEVGCRENDEYFEFFVKDNGAGIDPKYHQEIFGLFRRGGAIAVDEDGTGVGLSVVKAIVEQHGGRIWVESAVGQGATFVFTLPKKSDL